MRDELTARVWSLGVIVAALATLGAVVYLAVSGRQVNVYLVGLAGLTIGGLAPLPLTSPRTTRPGPSRDAAGCPEGMRTSRADAP